ncbi:hypothetical protein CKO42_17240 [Lamprobacter modestohalophilus]|uniref:Uncharacterized protein n=1 Tax=Lamprobacter modestohalophilus TaxID=1064514 RepID=A0A9X0WB14_9GAMM|nr:hypothetical protein [Lamprobacter modestohalophilus]MBK1620154.1 hypothetical protein [Lamprobacter modestohalophilus]
MELLIADTSGIQTYIFGSNRLRENIGASFLVEQATRVWALDLVRELTAGQCNLTAEREIDPSWCLDPGSSALAAEVIYSGGGNFLGLFGSAELAERFERALSLRVLTDAPGLNLVMARESFDWTGAPFAAVYQQLLGTLARAKEARPVSLPLAGMGVTRLCRSTGLPAVGLDRSFGQARPASAEILAKLAAARHGPVEARLRQVTGLAETDQFVFPTDLSELGASHGRNSYLAVVHADGNDMSGRFQRVLVQHAEDSRACIRALRALSAGVTEAAQVALREMVTTIKQAVTLTHGQAKIGVADERLRGLEITLSPEMKSDRHGQPPTWTGRWYLPLRPLVFGGDDLAFITDGRIGLEATVALLQAFARHSAGLPDDQGAASACAGVAIGKVTRPFSSAYALSEALCQNAKHARREHHVAGAMLDWHFGATATDDGLERLRQREYGLRLQGRERSLLLRPVALVAEPGLRGRSWTAVRSGIKAFQGADWLGRRNKTKALRDALRGGSDAVELFRNQFLDGGELPAVEDGREHWPRTGWDADLCGYFDAVEIFDRFLSLTQPQDARREEDM